MNLELRLGSSLSGTDIIWNGDSNPHLVAIGRSGSGKTFFIKRMIEQLAEQGILCIIFDCAGDFSDYYPSRGGVVTKLDVVASDFTVNPLIGAEGQSANVRAQQLLSLLHSIFRMGPRASIELNRTTVEYLNGLHRVPTISGLLHHVSCTENLSSGLAAALEPLELFDSLINCAERPISLDLTAPGLIILDFGQVIDIKLRSFSVELILQCIWNQQILHTSLHCPIVLVLDECQNLSWGENSMSIRLLREGRKYELAGWFSSQWLDHKSALAALGQASLQTYFHPDHLHTDKLAKALCGSRSSDFLQYRQLLQALQVGQFLWRRSDGRSVVVNVDP